MDEYMSERRNVLPGVQLDLLEKRTYFQHLILPNLLDEYVFKRKAI